MNDFGDHIHSTVADSEVFLQSLEGAVITAMTEAFAVKHIEGDRAVRYMALRSKRKSRFGIDEVPDQPSRGGAVYARSRPCHPHPVLVGQRTEFSGRLRRSRALASIRTR